MTEPTAPLALASSGQLDETGVRVGINDRVDGRDAASSRLIRSEDMSLFCDAGYDHDGADWWWYQPADEAPLATKRSRKCCSCGAKVGVGETARKVQRFRHPSERCNYIEESIYDDEVPLADWYLCETCGDLADSLNELGFCYSLGGESLKDQIAEYRREEAAHREYMKTHNAKLTGVPITDATKGD